MKWLLKFEPPLLIVDYNGILLYYKELLAINFEYVAIYDQNIVWDITSYNTEFVLLMISCDNDLKTFKNSFDYGNLLILYHEI